MNDEVEHDEGREIATVDASVMDERSKGEFQVMVDTAHRFPRQVSAFRKEALQLATLNAAVAGECIYALPRREKDRETKQWVTKTIEGPSARFAEIMMYSWRNARAAARVVNEGAEYITSQGLFYDTERNVQVAFEVQRRITNKNGERFSADMITVTANAASSIALRQAVLKGIPKALWNEMYMAARGVVAGDVKTLVNRRSDAIKEFAVFGVSDKQIFEHLGIGGIQDVTIDHMVLLSGYLTSMREDGVAPETIFAPDVARSAGLMPKEKNENGRPVEGGNPSGTSGAAARHGRTQSDGDSSGARTDTSVDPATLPPADHPAGGEEMAAPQIIAQIQKRMDAGALGTNDLKKRFGIESLEGITYKRAEELLAWIRDPSAA